MVILIHLNLLLFGKFLIFPLVKLTLARFVVLVHCCRVRLVVGVHASWKENQQSALSCLLQSVN